MPRGGYRVGSGAKKGSKYGPRKDKKVNKNKDKKVKENKVCILCGAVIIKGSGRSKYCSDECVKKAGETKAVFKEMICANCGIEFTGRKRKFCSKECCLLAHGHNSYYKPSPTCLICGKPLTEGQKKYCSSTCCQMACSRRNGMKPMKEYLKILRAESISKHGRICKQCGKSFIEHRGGRRTEGSGSYCSKLCYANAVKQAPRKPKIKKKVCNICFPICDVCGKVFTARSKATRLCSDKCKAEDARRRAYKCNVANKILKEYTCQECGKLFVSEYGNRRRTFCSEFCARKNYHHCKRNIKAKERAQELGVYYEPVNPLKVFKRDGWKCQLCGKKLKLKHRGTYRDDAPELDHIIPWAQGGEHSYRNTQCACRKCNSEKGAQEIGQLRLFG